MAVIQTLRGINFNNPDLPVLQQHIEAGLVGGYRAGSFSTDMSPAGNDLISTGDPVEGDSYVTASYYNYFDTGISLPDEFTIIAVFRAASTPSTNIFAVGDYSSSPGAGVSFFTRASGASGASAHSSVEGALLSDPGSQPGTDNSDFVWQAIAAGGGAVRWMVPKADFNFSRSYSGVLTAGTGTIKIGRANAGAGTVSHDIVETLIYDRALTAAELLEQYEYSSRFALGLGIEGI